MPLRTVAQASAGEPKDSRLYQTIWHMDSVLFNAFNEQDLAVLQSVFAPNAEFYHDKNGLQDYAAIIEGFRKVFKSNPGLKRQLVGATLEVYPVPGYGAIEMGEHRFVHTENGKEVVGLFKFVQVWQFKDNTWKVTRIVSVGHI